MNRSILVAMLAIALAAPGCAAHRLRLADRAAAEGNLESSFWLTRALARRGNAEAQKRLGLMYRTGEGVAKDDGEAVRWLRKAVARNHEEAALHLGQLYANGEGRPENDPQAPALLEKLCETGNSRGCYALAVWFLDGGIVTQSDDDALHWFRRAVEAWQPGQARVENLLLADELVDRAARLGLADAQYRLGEQYSAGDKKPRSMTEAATWFYLAAAQGHRDAVVKMGWIYGEGAGVPRDYNEAYRWFARGAELDIGEAQYQLGLLYMRGVGVRLNSIEAHKWFNLAAAKGHWPARQKLDTVAKRLKPKELAEAERLAVEWEQPTKE